MRNHSYFAMRCAETVNQGLKCLSCIDSKLWNSIPSHMKEIDSVNEFKHFIKTWKPERLGNLYSYRPCKVYLQNIGYLQPAKKKYMCIKIHIRLGKSEYHNSFFSFALRCTFTFPCLILCWNLQNLFEI